MASRRPVVHEDVEVVFVSVEVGLDDVAGIFGVDVMELGSSEREHGGIIDYCEIDAAFAW